MRRGDLQVLYASSSSFKIKSCKERRLICTTQAVVLPMRSPIEKATVTTDFSLENSQAEERKRDELAKAREPIPSKNICHQRREQRRGGPKKV